MKKWIHEVKISWASDPYAQRAVSWLVVNNMRPERDWQIDMHGGLEDHTSFWFHDLNKALIVKLTLGGV